MRFRLTHLLLLVALVAIACAALMQRTRWWADGIFVLTMLTFTIVALWSISLGQRGRAMALSFAIVGSFYLFYFSCSQDRDRLPTNIPLCALADSMNVRLSSFYYVQGGTNWDAVEATIRNAFMNQQFRNSLFTNELRNFFIIGHALWSLLFALLAAWLAGLMYDRRKNPSPRANVSH